MQTTVDESDPVGFDCPEIEMSHLKISETLHSEVVPHRNISQEN
jgi:hypothetical protein